MTITLTRKEAQQVLDALEFVYPLCEQLHHPKKYRHEFSQPCGVVEQYKATTETLRARLAQPYKEQANRVAAETNGRMTINPVTGDVSIGWASQPEPAETNERLRIGHDAMTWYDGQGNATMKIDASGPLVISPHPAFAKSKRNWQGLTDEELNEIYNQDGLIYKPLKFYRAIEAKLKEKNT